MYYGDITYPIRHMTTPFSALSIHSPCYVDPETKVRKGARVYYKEEFAGVIEEVEHKNSATVIRLENGKLFIYKFVDGSTNGFLYIA